MKDKNKTLVMSLEEGAQLEARIAAENLKATVNQASTGYQNPIVRDSRYEPDLSKMSPIERIEYWSGWLGKINGWLVDLNASERFEAKYLSGGKSHLGWLICAGKTDFDKWRSDIIACRADFHYLRGVAREEAGYLLGARYDFNKANTINPSDSHYKSELSRINKRILRSCLIEE